MKMLGILTLAPGCVLYCWWYHWIWKYMCTRMVTWGCVSEHLYFQVWIWFWRIIVRHGVRGASLVSTGKDLPASRNLRFQSLSCYSVQVTPWFLGFPGGSGDTKNLPWEIWVFILGGGMATLQYLLTDLDREPVESRLQRSLCWATIFME